MDESKWMWKDVFLLVTELTVRLTCIDETAEIQHRCTFDHIQSSVSIDSVIRQRNVVITEE